MSEILILARVNLHAYDLAIIADYYFNVGDRLQTVEGSHGLSVWRDERGIEAFMVCYEYADLAAAERGLAAIAEVRFASEIKTGDFSPADVVRVNVSQRSTVRLSQAPSSSMLSMSMRVADPGYGPELVKELEGIMDELQYFPGYIGSVCGPNDSLAEEVIGLVTWESREAFSGSLPPGSTMSQLSLYSRFF